MKKVVDGRFIASGYEYRGYELRNHGYCPADKCIWWEAINKVTGEADFHAHRRCDLKSMIDEALSKPT